MVDPVGAKPATTAGRIDKIQAAPIVRAASHVSQDSADSVDVGSLSALVADAASAAPIDYERVAQIREAIAANRYPIAAETLADRLIALKLNWIPHDPS